MEMKQQSNIEKENILQLFLWRIMHHCRINDISNLFTNMIEINKNSMIINNFFISHVS